VKNYFENFKKFFFIGFLLFFSIGINFYYAQKGLVYPDSFLHYDSGYNILNGKHPVRDYWAFSGIVIDYFQAFFFKLFGVNWNSYLIHSSFFNFIISILFFYFLIQNKLNIYISFVYSLALVISSVTPPLKLNTVNGFNNEGPVRPFFIKNHFIFQIKIDQYLIIYIPAAFH
jgi:hypothetical protein